MTGVDGVVLAMVSDTWADASRRGFYSTADQTIMSLLADDRIPRVVVADHPRGVLSRVKSAVRREATAPHTPYLRGVRPWVLSTPVPATTEAIVRRYRAYDFQLAAAARRHGLASPALVTFNIFHAAYGSHSWADSVCFYAQDDESAIPYKSAQVPLLNAAYQRISQRGIDVVAVSTVLLERIGPTGMGTVIPNGVDPDLWADPMSGPAVSAPGGAIVAYAGSIDSRLDIDAIAEIAADGNRVRLAGYVADAAVGAELSGIDGVELVGSIARERVAAFLRSADVCIMAHRRTPLTEAMSPLKVYEYLSTGKPVVATRLGSFADESDVGIHCTLVEPGGDYPAAVRRALSRGPLDESDRAALAVRLSWRRRHEPLIAHLLEERE